VSPGIGENTLVKGIRRRRRTRNERQNYLSDEKRGTLKWKWKEEELGKELLRKRLAPG
jgi:hypothetical protein